MKNSKTQIVATIGPASKDKDTIKKMIEHNLDAVRLNFSWGTYEEHVRYIANIREAAKEVGRRIPIIQDLSGPRIQEAEGHEFNESAEKVITEKDLKDLEFGVKQGVDYIAMSYVGNAADIMELREEIRKYEVEIPIIAKIERKKALENINEIIEAADAIMVARGDLGNAMPLEKIPFIQKMLVHKAKLAGKPVITATQMMLSMIESPLPTRAEVTDVAFAVLNGSDAIMLSEETATGKYPVEAVAMMERIVTEAEKYITEKNNFLEVKNS